MVYQAQRTTKTWAYSLINAQLKLEFEIIYSIFPFASFPFQITTTTFTAWEKTTTTTTTKLSKILNETLLKRGECLRKISPQIRRKKKILERRFIIHFLIKLMLSVLTSFVCKLQSFRALMKFTSFAFTFAFYFLLIFMIYEINLVLSPDCLAALTRFRLSSMYVAEWIFIDNFSGFSIESMMLIRYRCGKGEREQTHAATNWTNDGISKQITGYWQKWILFIWQSPYIYEQIYIICAVHLNAIFLFPFSFYFPFLFFLPMPSSAWWWFCVFTCHVVIIR